MARVMLHNKKLPKSFWGEAVNIACHKINRVYFRLDSKKTSYELWRGKKPVVKYFQIFGSDCYILRDRRIQKNLMQKATRDTFWDTTRDTFWNTPPLVELTKYIT